MTERTALETFIAAKLEIDTMLHRLQNLADDHFEVDFEEVNWGDATYVAQLAAQLKEACDFAFQEGEYKTPR